MKSSALLLLLLCWVQICFCSVLRRPVANDDVAQTFTQKPVVIPVLQNDYDPDGDPFSRPVPIVFPKNGTLSLNMDMSLTYTPDSGFAGIDTFVYEVCDRPRKGKVTCDQATVIVTVCPKARFRVSPQLSCRDEDVTMTLFPESSNPNIVYSWDFGEGAVPRNVTGPGPHTIQYTTSGFKMIFLTTTLAGTPSCDHVAYTSVFIKYHPPAEIIAAPEALCFGDTAVFEADNSFGYGDFLWDFGTGATPATQTGPGPHVVTYDTPGAKDVTVSVKDGGCTVEADTVLSVKADCCVDFEISAFLEGPFVPATGKMTTILNDFGFLPGESPMGIFFPIPTPIGQPYNTLPWMYDGMEGDTLGDGPGLTPYPPTVTDWVLVSLRKGGNLPSDEVFKQAALLHNDGTIEFVGPCFSTLDEGPYWVLVEHRNHMGALSDVPVTIDFNAPGGPKLEYDFRIQDSYTVLFSVGQKQLVAGSNVFGMFGGEVEKRGIQNFEINGADRAIWLSNNGQSESYNPADFNLNVEVNGNDNSVWLRNNGAASAVPK